MTDPDSSDDTRQLHKAYEAKTVEELAGYYDDWVGKYETHMKNVGYMHPAMVASMVARHVPVGTGLVLDAGAGTGIMGEILTALGHERIAGIDASERMLEAARAKGHYRELRHMVLGRLLDFPEGRFEAVVSAGVFTDGHAPLAGLDELARVTRAGGRMVFSVARSYLEGPFDEKRAALEAAGTWREIDRSLRYNSAPLGDSLVSQVFAFEIH